MAYTITSDVSSSSGTHLVTRDLALGIVLKVSVALEATLDQFAELGCEKLRVVQVVYAQTRAGSLGRVSGTDALLRCADAATARKDAGKCKSESADDPLSEQYHTSIHSPATTELDLLESIDDLVEVKHKVRTVRQEQAALAVESWMGTKS